MFPTKEQRRRDAEAARVEVEDSVDGTHRAVVITPRVHIEFGGLHQQNGEEPKHVKSEHTLTKVTTDKHKDVYGDTGYLAEELQIMIGGEEPKFMVIPVSSPHQANAYKIAQAVERELQRDMFKAANVAFTGQNDKIWKPSNHDGPREHYPVALAMPNTTMREDTKVILTALAKAYWHIQGRHLTITIKARSAGTPGAVGMFETINEWDTETYMAPKPIVVRVDLVTPLYNPILNHAMEKYVVEDALNDLDDLEKHEKEARPTWKSIQEPANEARKSKSEP